ncbi:MAG: hypothetical protein K0S18_2045 [Anaerocolumna sp.]|jgi:niacin transporter|nr:hypothetical protein [Anaerocolumna sp.]
MKQQSKVLIMTISALLCAIGIIIPMFAPKIIIEPASFTLASHVPVFIAMFISPVVAASVAVITGFGFMFAGFPPVVVLRALTHVIFAVVGAYILKKNHKIFSSPKSSVPFGVLISMVHALCEVIVVTTFYWGNNMSEAYYKNGYFMSVIILVGIGTFVHSMVDLTIATLVWKPIQNIISIPASVRIARK